MLWEDQTEARAVVESNGNPSSNLVGILFEKIFLK